MASTFKFWTKERDALIGTASDYKVGKMLGKSRGCVQWRRNVLGIVAYGQSCKLDEFYGARALLGKIPDVDIAKLIGVDKSTVRAYRRCRGIAACPRKG